MSYYREQLESYLKTLDITANIVFDFGGKQKPIKGRTKSWNVKEYEIFDIPEYNLGTELKLPKKADMIFCLEVFEYLIEPVTAMRNIKNHLNPKGNAIISFPLIYPLHNEVEFDSLRYTISGVKRIVEKCGLKINKVTNRKTKTKNLEQYYKDDGMKCAKGFEHNITGYIVDIIHG
jgi:2-polyprenyl-3-methyl-5-hydroxy-6-metoxy-1,4-benzoquinol methylase